MHAGKQFAYRKHGMCHFLPTYISCLCVVCRLYSHTSGTRQQLRIAVQCTAFLPAFLCS